MGDGYRGGGRGDDYDLKSSITTGCFTVGSTVPTTLFTVIDMKSYGSFIARWRWR